MANAENKNEIEAAAVEAERIARIRSDQDEEQSRRAAEEQRLAAEEAVAQVEANNAEREAKMQAEGERIAKRDVASRKTVDYREFLKTEGLEHQRQGNERNTSYVAAEVKEEAPRHADDIDERSEPLPKYPVINEKPLDDLIAEEKANRERIIKETLGV